MSKKEKLVLFASSAVVIACGLYIRIKGDELMKDGIRMMYSVVTNREEEE